MLCYFIRKNCLFCDNDLGIADRIFSADLDIPVAVYSVNPDTPEESMQVIPYNVAICKGCNTAQTVYLGDLRRFISITMQIAQGQL
jgi:hypothetical protein